MRYPIARVALVLLVIMLPVMAGCQFTPEDKWPVVTYTNVAADFTVTLEIEKTYGIPRLTIPSPAVATTIGVRTYRMNQPWRVDFVLERVKQVLTVYNEFGLPQAQYEVALPVTEIHRFDSVLGTPQPGGHPPQGTTELGLNFSVDWFPLGLEDWIQYGIDPVTGAFKIYWITDRYIYYFRAVVEDMDGRTDTFHFEIYSELVIKTK